MADTQQIYFTTLTAVGEAKDAKAKALGTALKFTAMAVGDGNGALPVPDRTRTALVREVRRAAINTLKQDPQNPAQLIAEQVIPENEGGYWIRELGLYDEDGDLFAIANCPETYKPVLAQGSGRTQVVRMVLVMTSAASVQLKIDPSVVLATRQYVDGQDAAHVAAADPHPQYLTEAEGQARIAAAVAALVNSSPAALDTLAELATALNNDKDFAATMAASLALKAPLASPSLTGNPKAPTPALFAADTNIATMAALQRALGNRQGVAVLVADTTLVAADGGKTFTAAGTTIRNINLPLKATLVDGWSVKVHSVINGFNTVISAQAGEQIDGTNASGALSSIAIGYGEEIEITYSAGAGKFQAVGANAANMKSSPMFAASKASSGYQLLPSGLIIQWGRNATDSAGNPVTAAYPIAFPNACLSASAAMVGSDLIQSAYTWAFDPLGSFNLPSKTQYRFWARNASGNMVPTIGFYWIAIGY